MRRAPKQRSLLSFLPTIFNEKTLLLPSTKVAFRAHRAYNAKVKDGPSVIQNNPCLLRKERRMGTERQRELRRRAKKKEEKRKIKAKEAAANAPTAARPTR
jgi:hypothetical protein